MYNRIYMCGVLSKIFIMRLLNNLDMDYSYTVSDYF